MYKLVTPATTILLDTWVSHFRLVHLMRNGAAAVAGAATAAGRRRRSMRYIRRRMFCSNRPGWDVIRAATPS
jgi:hypothetical protein